MERNPLMHTEWHCYPLISFHVYSSCILLFFFWFLTFSCKCFRSEVIANVGQVGIQQNKSKTWWTSPFYGIWCFTFVSWCHGVFKDVSWLIFWRHCITTLFDGFDFFLVLVVTGCLSSLFADASAVPSLKDMGWLRLLVLLALWRMVTIWLGMLALQILHVVRLFTNDLDKGEVHNTLFILVGLLVLLRVLTSLTCQKIEEAKKNMNQCCEKMCHEQQRLGRRLVTTSNRMLVSNPRK